MQCFGISSSSSASRREVVGLGFADVGQSGGDRKSLGLEADSVLGYLSGTHSVEDE